MKAFTRIAILIAILLGVTLGVSIFSHTTAPHEIVQSARLDALPASTPFIDAPVAIPPVGTSEIPVLRPSPAEPFRPSPNDWETALPAVPSSPSITPAIGLPITGNKIASASSLPESLKDVTSPRSVPAPLAKPANPFAPHELFVRLPSKLNAQSTVRVLVVLHGMGGRGEPFSQNLIQDAEKNNWLLIAPNLPYRNWLDPQLLMEDDILLSKRLLDTLDVLTQRLEVKTRRRVMLYGYSRGAQLAHRFAYFYPERVASVVTISAGTYTLPAEKRTNEKGVTQLIPFPYGVGDLNECVGKPLNWQELKKISFWIAVGERDNQPSDVPRAFDTYVGDNRVARAQTFQRALQVLGINARLVVFPNMGHEPVPDAPRSAMEFLRADEITNRTDD